MRKNAIWTVPLFCIAASLITFFLIVYGVGRFAVITLPDGTVTSSAGRELLIYGCIFAAALIIGGLLLFAKLTKKEIRLSATIMVVYQLVIILLQTLPVPAGRMALTLSFLGMAGEWCSFVPMLLYRVTGSLILSAVLGAFTPYIFLLFGKKSV